MTMREDAGGAVEIATAGEAVVPTWMASSGHCRNIMLGAGRDAGPGYERRFRANAHGASRVRALVGHQRARVGVWWRL